MLDFALFRISGDIVLILVNIYGRNIDDPCSVLQQNLHKTGDFEGDKIIFVKTSISFLILT